MKRNVLISLAILLPVVFFAQGSSSPVVYELRSPMLFDSIENFPANLHKVKSVKSFRNNQTLYIADFDAQGRITKLVNKTDPSKPLTTTWSYSSDGGVHKKVNTPTRWEDHWYTQKGDSVYIRVRSVDSLVIIRRPDGQLLDSAHYEKRKLQYRETRTYTEAGVIQHMIRRHGNISDPQSDSEETYEYDDNGNLIFYSAVKGRKPVATQRYTYNRAGLKTSDLILDADGKRLYEENIEYNNQNQPVRRAITGLQGDTTNTVIEIWEYDNEGRLILHRYPTTFLNVVVMNFEYRRYLKEAPGNVVTIKWIGNNLRMEKEEMNGNIRTVSKYKYAIRPFTTPKPGVELESDTLFLIESLEEYDTLLNAKVRTKSYTYDSKNKMDRISEHAYAYDSEGRLIRHDSKHMRLASKRQITQAGAMVYSYNANGSLANVSILDSAGKQTGYSTRKYNDRGQLIALDSCYAVCQHDSLSYDDKGRIVYFGRVRKYSDVSRDTTINTYSYSCEKLTGITTRRAKGYVQQTLCTYNSHCLPAEFKVIRENNKVSEAYRFEYEYYQ
jgi:hypothetical protein